MDVCYMNYSDFENSRIVSIGIPDANISNIYGRHWDAISTNIMGTHDLRSRFGTFPTPWGAKSGNLFTPPPFLHISDSLKDLLDSRAIELSSIAKNSNKKIVIMWSGGIDSTTVVSAFIKNLNSQDLTNISICLTTESILENANFYQKYIAPNFKCISYYDMRVTDEFLSNNILLHGDPGDCLFGPSLAMYAGETHQQLWKDNLSNIIKGIDNFNNHNTKPGFSEWYVNKITNNLLEVQPLGVDSVADWWWWHYYNFKWEFSIWRPFFRGRYDIKDPISIANIESYVKNTFFNTDKFQQWSYSNLKTHVGRNKQHHKKQAKQYIFELDKNLEYFTTKVKVPSDPTRLYRVAMVMYYDKNWVGHYLTEPGVQETAIELLESFTG